LVPIIAYIFIQTAGLIGGVAIGVAIIAAIPGGTSSNMFTFFAGGNVALSISVTAITTLACLISTPLILDFMISQYMPANFELPRGQIMSEIVWTLLLPLAIGMLVLRFFSKYAPVIARFSINASLLGIVAIVVMSALAGRLDVEAFGMANVFWVTALLVVMTLIAWLACRLMGLNSVDSTAIEMEVAVRNVNLGLLIKTLLFPAVVGQVDTVGNMVLFTLLLYGTVQLLMGGGLIAYRRITASTPKLV